MVDLVEERKNKLTELQAKLTKIARPSRVVCIRLWGYLVRYLASYRVGRHLVDPLDLVEERKPKQPELQAKLIKLGPSLALTLVGVRAQKEEEHSALHEESKAADLKLRDLQTSLAVASSQLAAARYLAAAMCHVPKVPSEAP
eukprot:2992459-Rhodomonas_salina.1